MGHSWKWQQRIRYGFATSVTVSVFAYGRVIPGTWRNSAKVAAESVVKVSNDIPAPYAATLSVNPATAYRLLADFENLSPGDVIIQNGANSMVGLAVVQMARERGIKTINIIRRDRFSACMRMCLWPS